MKEEREWSFTLVVLGLVLAALNAAPVIVPGNLVLGLGIVATIVAATIVMLPPLNRGNGVLRFVIIFISTLILLMQFGPKA